MTRASISDIAREEDRAAWRHFQRAHRWRRIMRVAVVLSASALVAALCVPALMAAIADGRAF